MLLDEIIAFLNANLGPNGTKMSLAVAVVVIAVAVWEAIREKRKVALDKDEWRAFELIDVLQLTHDVKRYRFALQSSDHVLGLPIGQHVSLKYTADDGNVVIRSYTPTSSDRDKGHVDICLKVYSPLPPRFPEGGKMSQYVDRLRVGEKILMRGPKVCFTYALFPSALIKGHMDFV
jgi:cytochrome-b5 reductase